MVLNNAPAKPRLTVPERDIQSGRLLTIADVCTITAFGRSTIYRKISEGQFPPPIRFSPNAVRWRASTIMAWIDKHEAQ